MKKWLIFLSLVALCLTFAGCGQNNYKILLNNASELRYNLFVGENNNLYATYMSGQREEPYVSDGIKNTLQDFGVLTLKFKSNVSVNEVQAEITIDGHTYTAVLEKNPYELNSYACDIEVLVGNEANISFVYVVNNVANKVDMAYAQSDWQVDCLGALQKASSELVSFIEKHKTGNKLQAEVFVKIAFDSTNDLKPYFWLVQIVAADGTSSQLVIDPLNNEVLVKTNAVG